MPQDAAFCAVSCGSILSRAFQNEIHHSAKRGKMRQIEAAKSSRKVVKRDFSTTRNLCPKDTICRAPRATKKAGFIPVGIVVFTVILSGNAYSKSSSRPSCSSAPPVLSWHFPAAASCLFLPLRPPIPGMFESIVTLMPL
jgi:hypothetical protein